MNRNGPVRHSDGSFDEVIQTDEDWFQGYVIDPSGHRELVGEATNRDSPERQIRQRLAASGHDCTDACSAPVNTTVFAPGIPLE